MTDDDARDNYVRAAMALHGYQLNEKQLKGVLLQFAHIEEIAEGFLDMPLPLDAASAPAFKP